MKIMMFNGLLLFLLFMWTSAETGPETELTEEIQVYANESRVSIQARKRACENLGGKCIKKKKDCPSRWHLETKPGKPYCSKNHRCCYPGPSCNLVWNYKEERPLIMIRDSKTIVPPVLDIEVSDYPSRIPIGRKLIFACPGANNQFNHVEGTHTKLHGECISHEQFKVCVNSNLVKLNLSQLSCSRKMHPSFIKDNATSDKNSCDGIGGEPYKQGYTYGDKHEFKDLEIEVCFSKKNQTTLCTSSNLHGNETDYRTAIKELPGRDTRGGDPEPPPCGTDNNKCKVNKGGCDHICTDTIGSYICSCEVGYTLADDQHACIDNNKCKVNKGGCDHICTDTIGSYICSCEVGYTLADDQHACIVITTIHQLTELLFDLDDNNLFGLLKPSEDGNKLISSIYSTDALFSGRPTYTALRDLQINGGYYPHVEALEDPTQRESKQEHFIETIMKTRVMKETAIFLNKKGYIDGTDKLGGVMNFLWFTMFSSAKKGKKRGSSGFEHVFCGEINSEKKRVFGLHNWVFSIHEQDIPTSTLKFGQRIGLDLVNSKNGGNGGKIVQVKFHWHSFTKYKTEATSMFIGTSPELEMAVYTVCFLMEPNQSCSVKMASKIFDIITKKAKDGIYGEQSFLGSAYPEVPPEIVWIPEEK